MSHRHSLLSCTAIRANLGKGIHIVNFRESQLNSTSYDVRLGEWYFRRSAADGGDAIMNPYDLEMVLRHYGQPIKAQPAEIHPQYHPDLWRNIEPQDRIIIMKPGEMILGHTEEFIGGTKDPKTGRCFAAEMKARSSAGRVGFEVCRCAGWGDVGYINRWTMEIVCTSPIPIILVVGTRLAQFKFYEVDPIEDCEMYGYDPERDHYQSGIDIESIIENWKPEMMIPRLTKT